MTEKVTQSVSNFRRLNLFLLPLLSISAIYCCWFLSIRNGLFRQIKEIFEQEHDERRFPGTREPFVQVYTSMRPLDKQLTTLVAFFAPVVQRSNPPLDLFAFWTFGQFAAVWSLMFMESLRQGNKNTIINWYVLSITVVPHFQLHTIPCCTITLLANMGLGLACMGYQSRIFHLL